jgi:putative transposase
LNRGNARPEIFHKDGDYLAFEKIIAQGLEQYDIELYCYQLMPNHWHLVLSPDYDGEMSRFMRWVTATHTMRYHAHHHSSGEGHVYQGRFKSFPIQADEHFHVVCRYVERNAKTAGLVRKAENWKWSSLWRWLQKPEPDPRLLSAWPIARLPSWVTRVNQALTNKEIARTGHSIQRSGPLGDEDWVQSTVKRLGLESTTRHRGRPRVRQPDQ